MAFELVARNLLKDASKTNRVQTIEERFDKLTALNRAGFSAADIFRDLRNLADECSEDEKGIKLQILKLATQLHGMLQPDEQVKTTPTIVLNINGDNTRINSMICPQLAAS